jgi:aminopeptidase N
LEWALVAAQAAKRALKNKALGYLSALDDPAVSADLLKRTRSATNMTDQIAALAGLCDSECVHLLIWCLTSQLCSDTLRQMSWHP